MLKLDLDREQVRQQIEALVTAIDAHLDGKKSIPKHPARNARFHQFEQNEEFIFRDDCSEDFRPQYLAELLKLFKSFISVVGQSIVARDDQLKQHRGELQTVRKLVMNYKQQMKESALQTKKYEVEVVDLQRKVQLRNQHIDNQRTSFSKELIILKEQLYKKTRYGDKYQLPKEFTIFEPSEIPGSPRGQQRADQQRDDSAPPRPGTKSAKGKPHPLSGSDDESRPQSSRMTGTASRNQDISSQAQVVALEKKDQQLKLLKTRVEKKTTELAKLAVQNERTLMTFEDSRSSQMRMTSVLDEAKGMLKSQQEERLFWTKDMRAKKSALKVKCKDLEAKLQEVSTDLQEKLERQFQSFETEKKAWDAERKMLNERNSFESSAAATTDTDAQPTATELPPVREDTPDPYGDTGESVLMEKIESLEKQGQTQAKELAEKSKALADAMKEIETLVAKVQSAEEGVEKLKRHNENEARRLASVSALEEELAHFKQEAADAKEAAARLMRDVTKLSDDASRPVQTPPRTNRTPSMVHPEDDEKPTHMPRPASSLSATPSLLDGLDEEQRKEKVQQAKEIRAKRLAEEQAKRELLENEFAERQARAVKEAVEDAVYNRNLAFEAERRMLEAQFAQQLHEQQQRLHEQQQQLLEAGLELQHPPVPPPDGASVAVAVAAAASAADAAGVAHRGSSPALLAAVASAGHLKSPSPPPNILDAAHGSEPRLDSQTPGKLSPIHPDTPVGRPGVSPSPPPARRESSQGKTPAPTTPAPERPRPVMVHKAVFVNMAVAAAKPPPQLRDVGVQNVPRQPPKGHKAVQCDLLVDPPPREEEPAKPRGMGRTPSQRSLSELSRPKRTVPPARERELSRSSSQKGLPRVAAGSRSNSLSDLAHASVSQPGSKPNSRPVTPTSGPPRRDRSLLASTSEEHIAVPVSIPTVPTVPPPQPTNVRKQLVQTYLYSLGPNFDETLEVTAVQKDGTLHYADRQGRPVSVDPSTNTIYRRILDQSTGSEVELQNEFRLLDSRLDAVDVDGADESGTAEAPATTTTTTTTTSTTTTTDAEGGLPSVRSAASLVHPAASAAADDDLDPVAAANAAAERHAAALAAAADAAASAAASASVTRGKTVDYSFGQPSSSFVRFVQPGSGPAPANYEAAASNYGKTRSSDAVKASAALEQKAADAAAARDRKPRDLSPNHPGPRMPVQRDVHDGTEGTRDSSPPRMIDHAPRMPSPSVIPPGAGGFYGIFAKVPRVYDRGPHLAGTDASSRTSPPREGEVAGFDMSEKIMSAKDLTSTTTDERTPYYLKMRKHPPQI